MMANPARAAPKLTGTFEPVKPAILVTRFRVKDLRHAQKQFAGMLCFSRFSPSKPWRK